MKKLVIAIVLLIPFLSYGQYINRDSYSIWQGQMSIGKNTTTKPDANTILEIGRDSATKGLKLPRVVDTANITGTGAQKKGIFIYQIKDSSIYVHDGAKWKPAGGGSYTDAMAKATQSALTPLNYNSSTGQHSADTTTANTSLVTDWKLKKGINDSLNANYVIWQYGGNDGLSLLDFSGDTAKFRNIVAGYGLIAEYIGDSVLRLRVDPSVITGGSQTLQQVFNQEVGGSQLSKGDTILTDADSNNGLSLKVFRPVSEPYISRSLTGYGFNVYNRPNAYTYLQDGQVQMKNPYPVIELHDTLGFMRMSMGWDATYKHSYIDMHESTDFVIENGSIPWMYFIGRSSNVFPSQYGGYILAAGNGGDNMVVGEPCFGCPGMATNKDSKLAVYGKFKSYDSARFAGGIRTWNNPIGVKSKVLYLDEADSTVYVGEQSTPISSLTPALKYNNINNGKYSQEWHWGGDTLKKGLTIQTNAIRSDITNGYNFIEMFSRGTNTLSSVENNTLHVGNNTTGGSGNTKNIAGKFTASGAAWNLAIYVPKDSGKVGIGINTPAWPLHVDGTAAVGTLRTDDILLTGIPGSANQFIAHNGVSPVWRILGTSDLPTIPISGGGTGQTTANAAMNALLPTKTGNSLKVLRVNAAETDYELATVSGGSGSPGGSTTQVQYNNAGAFAGISGATTDGTKMTLTNPAVNNVTGSYTTTATAAGTTTLTVSSTYLNVFTGSTTQTVVMPDATTLVAGTQYQITNNSTGVVTVNKNGGTLIKALAANTSAIITVNDISSAAGGWYVEYSSDLAIGSATGNDLTLASEVPTTPAADNMKLFAYKVGGRVVPGFIDPAGLDNALQPMFARNGIKKWLPSGNGTAIVADGAAALTATGTATAANVATTNRHTQIRGLEYLVTAASTTAVAGFREGANQNFMGNSAGNGGFFMICRFGPATGVATTTNRCFVGMTSSTGAPTDVEPSTLTNMFGCGWDAADANIQFFNNDGSGTATKTSLGIAVPTADRTSVYELTMFCAPNSTTLYYQFKDLAEGGSSVTGTVTTDLPTANTLLSARGWMSVGGTSSVIGIAIKSLYIETDY